MHRGDRAKIGLPFGQKFSRDIFQRKSQKVLHLAGSNDHRYSGGKARHHRVRDELDQAPNLEKPGSDQDQPGHECGDQQAIIAMQGNHIEHDDDKGAGWPTPLNPGATKKRDQKPGNNGRDKPLVG